MAFWVALIFVFHYTLSTGLVGYEMRQKDGSVYVAAGSSPVDVAWAVVAIFLFAGLMTTKTDETADGVPSLKRRFLAFIIDFLFSLCVLTSLGGLLPLWAESVRTGHFLWHFSRDYSVTTDAIFAFPLVLCVMGLTLLYFAWPLTRGKQTVVALSCGCG
jgi:hypothetical protein